MHKHRTWCLPLAAICLLAISLQLFASESTKTLLLYHDADWSNHVESAESIWRGVETALSEIDHKIQGHTLKLIKKDHSGNVLLSKKNMSDYLADEKALALISGIHSPPLIRHRDFINENQILTLVPWAAGAPVTRYPGPNNSVFRLSVDDSKAGEVLVDFALKKKNCKSPHLLLESTAWGKSNLASMTNALQHRNISSVLVTRFDWNLKTYSALALIQKIIEQKSDCILLVANAIEGAVIVKAMTMIPESIRVPIISHWGITGGRFHEEIHHEIRNKLELNFIQSCFSFMGETLTSKGVEVLDRAIRNFPNEIKEAKDIRSPVGFIHGYDITLLLIQAIRQIKLSDNIEENRRLIRNSLETLRTPVNGLIKTYYTPFSAFNESNLDAHEALGIDDYCMAKYGPDDEILLLQSNNASSDQNNE